MKKLSIAMSAILGSLTLLAAPNDANPQANDANGVNSQGVNSQGVNSRTNSATQKAANSKTRATNSQNQTNEDFQPVNYNDTESVGTSVSRVYRQKQQGLMPSELDRFNHNVYYADADAIRGARDTEAALRYIPFVTIVNTAGFGQSFDFRGQGRNSSNGVKFFINGVAANPLDSYYGFMPINSILPNLIQEIKVYPGSGTVLYGSGAKGAVLDIITIRRQVPYFSIGAGYANNSGDGVSYYAHAHAAELFGNLNVNAGVGYSHKAGPRYDEKTNSGQALLGFEYDFGLGRLLDVDFDFFMGKVSTTPYNSFWDNDTIRAFPTGVLTTPEFDPKNDPFKSGDGEIESSQTRFTSSIGYTSDFTDRLSWDIKAFYSFDERKYDTYTLHIPFFAYGSQTFTPSSSGELHTADQSGSKFSEHKFGARAKLDYAHDNGDFIFGFESMYEKSRREVNQILQSATQSSGNFNGKSIRVDINNELDMSKWTNAVFVMENYRFTQNFSLEGGLRYEITKYSSDTTDYISGSNGSNTTTNPNLPQASDEQNTGNFIFELSPAFRYSNTGSVYARYEHGYTTLPPFAMSIRNGSLNLTNMTHDFTYTQSNLKDETYDSFELGFKDNLGSVEVPLYISSMRIDGLLFAVNAFYTMSKNEFYFTGDPYAGLQYATYDNSRRYGGEISLEQYLFGGKIGLNESFTYTKAEGKDANGEWSQIPYTYDYKATLGAFFKTDAWVEIIDVSLGVWLQNSFYGGQKVYYSTLQGNGVVYEDKKLDPYVVSDFGISIGFNKDAFVITTGVKNVFDTFYYDYYNHDISAPIGEYRYLVGQGRTVFVELNYNY